MPGCHLVLTTGDDLLLTTGDPLTLTTTCVELGLAVETDTAFPIGIAEGEQLGLATETDTSFPLTSTKVLTFGLAVETDTGLSLILPAAPVTSPTDTPGSGPSAQDRAHWERERERLATERERIATIRDDEDVLIVLT